MRAKPPLTNKRQLEIQLAKLKVLDNPRLDLEQYPVSPEVASELLFMGAFEHHDLHGRVLDLGTGTGRLAIGAALVGAASVIGADLDAKAVSIAKENSAAAGVDVEWVTGDIECIRGEFDAIVTNPPFGTRSPHQDAKFLLRSFDLAPVTYSIHKSSTRDYLTQLVKEQGRQAAQVRSMTMMIPHMFSFHRKKWAAIEVDLYRITA